MGRGIVGAGYTGGRKKKAPARRPCAYRKATKRCVKRAPARRRTMRGGAVKCSYRKATKRCVLKRNSWPAFVKAYAKKHPGLGRELFARAGMAWRKMRGGCGDM